MKTVKVHYNFSIYFKDSLPSLIPLINLLFTLKQVDLSFCTSVHVSICINNYPPI